MHDDLMDVGPGDTFGHARNAVVRERGFEVFEQVNLALLWQIYLRRFLLQIPFLQYGHRCGGSRTTNATMAWRTAGNVG